MRRDNTLGSGSSYGDDRCVCPEAPVLAVAFILTLDEFVKIPAVYRHYMKYKWVRNITKEQIR